MTTAAPVRLNLSDAVDDLQLPPPPPCFLNSIAWRGYLKGAAVAQNQRKAPRVILIVEGEPAFNYGFNFCRDCDSAMRQEKERAGRCNPKHLQELAPK